MKLLKKKLKNQILDTEQVIIYQTIINLYMYGKLFKL